MSAYSTPGPMWRVRWVPRRSSNSVRGIAVDCGGATGNTLISAASTVAVPISNPPRARTSTCARIGYRPQRSATAATVCRWRELGQAASSRIPADRRDRELYGRPRPVPLLPIRSAGACSLSKHRCEPGSRVHLDLRHRPLPADRTQHARASGPRTQSAASAIRSPQRPKPPPRRWRSPASAVKRASATPLRGRVSITRTPTLIVFPPAPVEPASAATVPP